MFLSKQRKILLKFLSKEDKIVQRNTLRITNLLRQKESKFLITATYLSKLSYYSEKLHDKLSFLLEQAMIYEKSM